MKIEWNKVTWYSKLLALLLAFTILAFGIYIGMLYQSSIDAGSGIYQSGPVYHMTTKTK